MKNKGSTLVYVIIFMLAASIMTMGLLQGASYNAINVAKAENGSKVFHAIEAALEIAKANMYYTSTTSFQNYLNAGTISAVPSTIGGVSITNQVRNNTDDSGGSSTDTDGILEIWVTGTLGGTSITASKELMIKRFSDYNLAKNTSCYLGNGFELWGDMHNNGYTVQYGNWVRFHDFVKSMYYYYKYRSWYDDPICDKDDPSTSQNEAILNYQPQVVFPSYSSSQWQQFYNR